MHVSEEKGPDRKKAKGLFGKEKESEIRHPDKERSSGKGAEQS
jgi:hypothetical protein